LSTSTVDKQQSLATPKHYSQRLTTKVCGPIGLWPLVAVNCLTPANKLHTRNEAY